jgi:Protein of unknown function (DUF2971)
MWRGYGGNGSGVAIVYDTEQLPVWEESPLIIRKVEYGTDEDRIDRLKPRITQLRRSSGSLACRMTS